MVKLAPSSRAWNPGPVSEPCRKQPEEQGLCTSAGRRGEEKESCSVYMFVLKVVKNVYSKTDIQTKPFHRQKCPEDRLAL